jgi:secreted PhoX family phosphatase
MVSRRKFFALAGAGAAGTILAAAPLKALYSREIRGQSIRGQGYGSPVRDPNGLLDLPPGFQYRILSQTGNVMSDGNPVPGNPDGMAAFAGRDNTIILVRNHEMNLGEWDKPAAIAPSHKTYDPTGRGGTTTLILNRDRRIIRDFVSLAGTHRNCAGGATPWGSWISCEEDVSTPDTEAVDAAHGYNFEVLANATEPVDPVPLTAMGRFNHEAIAVDPATGIVYQTEDRPDGLFYRFIPDQPGNLQAGGVLQAIVLPNLPTLDTSNRIRTISVGQPMQAEWVTIADPNPPADTVRLEGANSGAAQFSRGEGIWYGNGEFYFCCTIGGATGLGQVWRYVPGSTAEQGGTLELFVEPTDANHLKNPDNITLSPFGDLFICEDGSDRQSIIGVTPDGELYQFAHNALNPSELAGVCFAPDGETLFVNIQNPGITLAIWGPWISA